MNISRNYVSFLLFVFCASVASAVEPSTAHASPVEPLTQATSTNAVALDNTSGLTGSYYLSSQKPDGTYYFTDSYGTLGGGVNMTPASPDDGTWKLSICTAPSFSGCVRLNFVVLNHYVVSQTLFTLPTTTIGGLDSIVNSLYKTRFITSNVVQTDALYQDGTTYDIPGSDDYVIVLIDGVPQTTGFIGEVKPAPNTEDLVGPSGTVYSFIFIHDLTYTNYADVVANSAVTSSSSITLGEPRINFVSSYFMNPTEVDPTKSERNPTQVKTTIGLISDTVAIDNTIAGTSTATTSVSLTDGTYTYITKFSNYGLSTPFPLTYVGGSFKIVGGMLTDVSQSEILTNNFAGTVDVPYAECSIANIQGCITNSFRFLFVPSQESINSLVNLKETLSTKAPFSYALDIPNVVRELFNTDSSQSLSIDMNLGFGHVQLLSREMIADFALSNEIRTLISYLLWIMFAMAMYRMTLGVHDKKTV